MLIENLCETTVVALCTVHDSISTLEDHFTKLPLTPTIKRHVMSARMRYDKYLDEQKKESLNEQQRKKRKEVQLSIREAERKKGKVNTSIDILGKEADDLAKSAEAKHDFTLLTKSNALRLKVAQVGLGVGSWPSNRATEGSNPKGTRLYFVILLKNVEKSLIGTDITV